VARGCYPPGANVFVAAPTPAIRSPIDILMVTTIALVWTVNSTLSWGCKISEFHIFSPPNAAPCTLLPGADAPWSPIPAATACLRSSKSWHSFPQCFQCLDSPCKYSVLASVEVAIGNTSVQLLGF